MSLIPDPLKCGECGCETFRLVHFRPHATSRFGDVRPEGFIEVVCTKCGDKTTISVEAHLKSEGNLCGGWNT